MPKCIFRSCPHFMGKNCFSPGITLHVFPKDLSRIKLWLQQTAQYYDDIDDFAETILSSKIGSYRMCSAHFVPECYMSQGTKEVLKPDAVPTVFPGNVVEVAIKHVPQKKKQRLEEREETRRRARWSQVDAGTSTIHILQTEMGTQTDLTMVTIQSCSVSVPRWNTIDRGIQWPEYEFNFYGEDWKVQLDHMYFNSRFKCIQELPNMDQEEIMKDHYQVPSTAQPHGSSQEDYRVTQQEPRKAESEPGTSPEAPEGYFFSKCSLRNKKTLCILQAKLVALLRHMTEAPHMGSYKRQRTRKLLSQIVEIVCLVAGEDLKLVKKNEDLSKFYQKEGEIPVRYQDVAVFFTRDEWNYIEENEELYKKEILSDPNESKEDQVEDFIDDLEEGAEITDDHFFKLLEVNTQGHSPGAAPVGRKRKKTILPTMPCIPEDAAGGREHEATDRDDSRTCKSEYLSDVAEEETVSSDMKPRIKMEDCAPEDAAGGREHEATDRDDSRTCKSVNFSDKKDAGEEEVGCLRPLDPGDVADKEAESNSKVLKTPVYKMEDCAPGQGLTMAPVGLFIYFQSAHTPLHKRRKKLLLPHMPCIKEDVSDGEEHEDTKRDKTRTCKSEYFSDKKDAGEEEVGCLRPLAPDDVAEEETVSSDMKPRIKMEDCAPDVAEEETVSSDMKPRIKMDDCAPEVSTGWSRADSPRDAPGPMLWIAEDGTTSTHWTPRHSSSSATPVVKRPRGHRKQIPKQPIAPPDTGGVTQDTAPYRTEHSKARLQNSPSSGCAGRPRPPQGMLWCDVCRRCFHSAAQLETHRAAHGEETPLRCEDCARVFDARSDLEKHQAKEHGKLRYPCQVCGLQYNYRSQYIIHQRTHTGEKPFCCKECGQAFGHKCSLLIHMRKHSASSLFECGRCGKLLDTEQALEKHRKLRFCVNCKKCFTRRALRRHLKTHMPEEKTRNVSS